MIFFLSAFLISVARTAVLGAAPGYDPSKDAQLRYALSDDLSKSQEPQAMALRWLMFPTDFERLSVSVEWLISWLK